jgi:Uma2 family endonuclease
MAAPPRSSWSRADYERDAREYLASLPLEHFMESTLQSGQRAITVAGFSLMKLRRPGFHFFSELLVHVRKDDTVLRVVPDNMVVLGELDDLPRTSYPLDLEPCPLFWVLEYVSESNRRKDYRDNFEKYEGDLKVPCYLIFDPEEQELLLYRHSGTRYLPVEPNEHGRLAVPELEMEVALLDGWARFWHRGELLPVPTEMQGQLDELRRQAEADRKERERLAAQNQQLEERLTKETGEKKRLSDLLTRRDEEKQQLAERLTKEADEKKQLADEKKQLADLLRRQQERDEASAALLRPLVEARARQAGRQDVLDHLPATTDLQQLTRWLGELD